MFQHSCFFAKKVTGIKTKLEYEEGSQNLNAYVSGVLLSQGVFLAIWKSHIYPESWKDTLTHLTVGS